MPAAELDRYGKVGDSSDGWSPYVSHGSKAWGVTGQEDAMSLSGFLPAASRRAMVVGSVAAFVCAVSSSVLMAQGAAQAPAPQTPAAQAPPPAPVPGSCPQSTAQD